MAYVFCRAAPPSSVPGTPPQIICTDEAGTEWTLTEDSQVGDWLRFVEDGGTVDPYEPPPAPEEKT